jgi:hypothetical protein
MKPIEKALLLRKSARLRSKEPMRLFINRLREPERILKLVERQHVSSATRLEARRQFLVSVCAAFEGYWRAFVRVNVDAHRIPASALEHLKKISFTLADIHNVVGRRLTMGELVSCSFAFQGPDAVNASLSEILQTKVFTEFAKARFTIREVPQARRPKKRPLLRSELTGEQMLKSTRDDLERCFEVRHDTVHNTGALHRVTEMDALMIANSAWQFNTFLGAHIEKRFAELWGPR